MKNDLRLMESSLFVVNVCGSCLGTFSFRSILGLRALLIFLFGILGMRK